MVELAAIAVAATFEVRGDEASRPKATRAERAQHAFASGLLPAAGVTPLVLGAAFEHVSGGELWWMLYGLEGHETTPSAARRMVGTSGPREAAAFRRLEQFTSSVAGEIETDEKTRVLDEIEIGLVNDAGFARFCRRSDKRHLDRANSHGARAVVTRRREAVRRLRSALPLQVWTWKRIGELILASSSMKPQPCPGFVAEYDDPTRLEAWLRQVVRDRRV